MTTPSPNNPPPSTKSTTPPDVAQAQPQAPLPPQDGLPAGHALSFLGQLLWPVLALAALLLFNAVFGKSFYTLTTHDGHLYGNLVDILKNGAPVILLSLGMTLVIATGGIDLSVGAVMAICGALAVCLFVRPAYSPISGINLGGSLFLITCVSLLVGAIAGLWNGILVSILKLQPIIATLILMVAGRGIALFIVGGQQPSINHPGFIFYGEGFLLGVPFPTILALATTGLMIALVRGTALGMLLEATGNNPIAARLVGINAAMVKLACYTVCGFLAGVAGLVATANIKSANPGLTGLNLELDAILAVAVGGTSLAGGRFSLVGSVIGALVIQTLNTTILNQGVAQDLNLVIKAAVVIAVCLLQSPAFRSKLAQLKDRSSRTPKGAHA